MKEAVRFFDPVSNQPESIITDDMRRSVKSAHAMYREWLEREEEEEEERSSEKETDLRTSSKRKGKACGKERIISKE